mmetsp:Transcript_15893/g.29989  ORF Transcript_15893/g.29989 Transcript_15893/m.29989 type:complete len:210 (+) Transcript_15893:305-934(+)
MNAIVDNPSRGTLNLCTTHHIRFKSISNHDSFPTIFTANQCKLINLSIRLPYPLDKTTSITQSLLISISNGTWHRRKSLVWSHPIRIGHQHGNLPLCCTIKCFFQNCKVFFFIIFLGYKIRPHFILNGKSPSSNHQICFINRCQRPTTRFDILFISISTSKHKDFPSILLNKIHQHIPLGTLQRIITTKHPIRNLSRCNNLIKCGYVKS